MNRPCLKPGCKRPVRNAFDDYCPAHQTARVVAAPPTAIARNHAHVKTGTLRKLHPRMNTEK